MVSYYTFDNDTGTTVLDTAGATQPDASGTFAGTGTAFTAAADALGETGQALSLTGTGWVNFGVYDLFNFADSSTQPATTVSSTIELWFRPGWNTWPGPVPGYDPCLAAARDSATTLWSMHVERWLNNGGVYVGCQGMHWGSRDLHADVWHQMVYVFDTSTWTSKVYVDGALATSFWGMGCNGNQPFQIGASSSTGAEGFIGRIDEVSVYQKALSDQTIAAHYVTMHGAGFDDPTATSALVTAYETAVRADSPMGLYTFEGDVNAVTDTGSTGANGVLVAPTYWTNGFAGGQALGLDITGAGRVLMGPVPAFAFPSGTGTIEAWIAPDPSLKTRGDALGRPAVLSVADDFSAFFHYGLELRSSDATFGVETYNDGYHTQVGIPGGLPAASKWYHLAAVFNAGTVDYYINGQSASAQQLLNLAPPPTQGDPPVNFLANFQIGAVDPQGDWGFVGKIDEVALYGAALTAEQIKAHFGAVAITFSSAGHDFINPTDMSPQPLTVYSPGRLPTPDGFQVTFTYDPAVISVTTAGVTIPSGTAINVPAGTTSMNLLVTPLCQGTTTLSVAAPASSGVFGTSATYRVQATDIVVDDDFNDGNLGSNACQPGSGFYLVPTAKPQTEANSQWQVNAGGGWWDSGGINSKEGGNFTFMNATGSRIQWVVDKVTVTAKDIGSKGQFLGGELSDCRHELGVVSAKRTPNSLDGQLFNNNLAGGIYVNLFYTATSGVPTSSVSVTGSVKVISKVKNANNDWEDVNGLSTPVTFALPGVTTLDGTKPLIVTLELNQSGWKLGFSDFAHPVFAPRATGVTVVNSKVTGGWDAASLADAAITDEFSTGGYLHMMFQNLQAGAGTAAMGSVKVCRSCRLATDCPIPFADADEDGDVDEVDFGKFQACYTGVDGGIPSGCTCFNRAGVGGIDMSNLTRFLQCWSGPNIPANTACGD